jgi:hypothetical protein
MIYCSLFFKTKVPFLDFSNYPRSMEVVFIKLVVFQSIHLVDTYMLLVQFLIFNLSFFELFKGLYAILLIFA